MAEILSEEERIAEEIEEHVSFPISIGKGMPRDKEDKVAFVKIWCNDMFAWACSHTISFYIRGIIDLEEIKIKFLEWYDKYGKAVMDRFDEVPYPELNEKDQYNWDDVETFFEQNCLIAADLEDSINNFCGETINKDFSRTRIRTHSLWRRVKNQLKKAWR